MPEHPNREPEYRFFAVDRIEGKSVVLVADDGTTSTVDVSALLPVNAQEGIVLSVPLGAGRVPDWEHAQVDDAERHRRTADSRARIDRIVRQDPGGDIEI